MPRRLPAHPQLVGKLVGKLVGNTLLTFPSAARDSSPRIRASILPSTTPWWLEVVPAMAAKLAELQQELAELRRQKEAGELEIVQLRKRPKCETCPLKLGTSFVSRRLGSAFPCHAMRPQAHDCQVAKLYIAVAKLLNLCKDEQSA